MHSESGLQLTSVRIDKDTYFFLPTDFADEHGRDEAALRSFMRLDIFSFNDGCYLPKSTGFSETMAFAKEYLQSDEARLAQLFFHNISHTFHPVRGVLPVALKMAIIDGVPSDQRNYECIALAAALHDIGNIVQRQKHENISVDQARLKLTELGYDQCMIEGVANCIYSTAIDYQSGCPSRVVGSRDAKLLSDADLSNPGFHDARYFAIESIKLWLELDLINIDQFAEQGVDFTLAFFDSIGDYHTSVARYLFGQQKQQNMLQLRQQTASILTEANGSLEGLKAVIASEEKRMMAP